jgi:pilus assembly protein Flp/PilA
MNAQLPSRRHSTRGQGMTEYILIVSLMAIASIGIITLYGDNVRRLFAMSADSLAGNDSVAQANSISAVANFKITQRTLKEFAFDNTPY